MTDRLTIDQITSNGLDQLYDERDRAEAALARIEALAEEYPVGIDTALIHEALALAEPAPHPTATQATELEKTTRVFAALHQPAEQDVTRIIDLYERWLAAGPPPLGTPVSRWWDRRLIELHNAIRPPDEQPATTANNGADHGPSVREAAADDRAHWTQKYAGE